MNTTPAALWLPSRYLTRFKQAPLLSLPRVMHTPHCPSILLPAGGMGLRGKVKCSVIDARTKRVVREYPEQCNLILNQGLDYIAARSIAANFAYCVAGTGTTDTTVTSGADTASTSAGTLTVSTTGYLAGTSADVGKTFKIGSDVYKVTAHSSTTQATVTPTTNTGSATFTMYNTQQLGLTTESKRSNTYLTGTGNCDTSWASPTLTMYRTYDFSAEVGSVGYNEIGLSYTATVSNNLFSRIKLASTVNLTAGQQLRVKYTLAITLSPITEETISSSPITGWAGATGKQRLQVLGIDYVATTGGTTQFYDTLNPHSIGTPTAICLSSNSDALGTPAWQAAMGVNRSTNMAYKLASLLSYSAGNFYTDKQAVFGTTEGNRSDWRSIFIGAYSNTTAYGICYLLDSNQTKDSLHTLTLTFRFTWNRSY